MSNKALQVPRDSVQKGYVLNRSTFLKGKRKVYMGPGQSFYSFNNAMYLPDFSGITDAGVPLNSWTPTPLYNPPTSWIPAGYVLRLPQVVHMMIGDNGQANVSISGGARALNFDIRTLVASIKAIRDNKTWVGYVLDSGLGQTYDTWVPDIYTYLTNSNNLNMPTFPITPSSYTFMLGTDDPTTLSFGCRNLFIFIGEPVFYPAIIKRRYARAIFVLEDSPGSQFGEFTFNAIEINTLLTPPETVAYEYTPDEYQFGSDLYKISKARVTNAYKAFADYAYYIYKYTNLRPGAGLAGDIFVDNYNDTFLQNVCNDLVKYGYKYKPTLSLLMSVDDFVKDIAKYFNFDSKTGKDLTQQQINAGIS